MSMHRADYLLLANKIQSKTLYELTNPWLFWPIIGLAAVGSFSLILAVL
tara:strand:- start:558 stop:704 length:147 start_codon:yes stop_codon:yes gene_type:complete